MEWKEYAHQGWENQKKPLKTDSEKSYGKLYLGKGRNMTTPKESKAHGSAQRTAMKPKDVACKY